MQRGWLESGSGWSLPAACTLQVMRAAALCSWRSDHHSRDGSAHLRLGAGRREMVFEELADLAGRDAAHEGAQRLRLRLAQQRAQQRALRHQPLLIRLLRQPPAEPPLQLHAVAGTEPS